MADNVWELRKSFEALKIGEDKAEDESIKPLGEPVELAPMVNGDTSSPSNAADDLHANLDLSLGDELDSLEDVRENEHSLTLNDSIDSQQKYSPKLSIEDNLDRLTLPIHNKRTSIISQRSAISADLVNFNNANVEKQAERHTAFNNKQTVYLGNDVGASSSDKHIDSSGSSFVDVDAGSVISLHNVCYEVKVPGSTKGRCGCSQKENKFILKEVSGVFKPGVNAVMGPTGSGKSSLLDILAARKDPAGLSGHVLVNGARQPTNFKCMVGYVIQDDTVCGMLTPRENLQFSAALRLPPAMTQRQRNERVDTVLNDLYLSKCADTRVGTELRRGISGGERKRTNIGMELITQPSILFLDEPTTGLDANTAQSVIHLLQRLSQRGTTIVLSIHQPRYSIFKLFDQLLLLSHGETVYHGPAHDALQYYTQCGYSCEEHNNPADFFLDIINGGVMPYCSDEDVALTQKLLPASAQNGIGSNAAEQETLLEMEEGEDMAAGRQKDLVQSFRKSSWNSQLISELTPIYLQFEKNELNTTLVRQNVDYPTTHCQQMRVVSRRTFQNMYRNPHNLATQSVTAIILALLVGTIFYQVDDSYTSGIQNRQGAFFFIVMNYVFSNMAAVDIFIKERALFIHENVSGYYRMSSYYLSKLLCDVVPQRGLPIMLFTAIVYFMIGLRAEFSAFAFFVLNTLLTSLSGTSVALMFSATVSSHGAGTALTSLLWVIMMVFSGVLVNVNTVLPMFSWLQYLSIFRYSMNAFTVNELKDAMFCDAAPGNSTTPLCDSGNAHMERQGIPHTTAWDLWHNELALLIIALVFLTLAYVQLRRIRHHR